MLILRRIIIQSTKIVNLNAQIYIVFEEKEWSLSNSETQQGSKEKSAIRVEVIQASVRET